MVQNVPNDPVPINPPILYLPSMSHSWLVAMYWNVDKNLSGADVDRLLNVSHE